MVQAITVAPIADGWTVKAEPFESEMFFYSGANAEAAARNLGARFADVGAAVEIKILLRDGTLGGRFACIPGRLPMGR